MPSWRTAVVKSALKPSSGARAVFHAFVAQFSAKVAHARARAASSDHEPASRRAVANSAAFTAFEPKSSTYVEERSISMATLAADAIWSASGFFMRDAALRSSGFEVRGAPPGRSRRAAS